MNSKNNPEDLQQKIRLLEEGISQDTGKGAECKMHNPVKIPHPALEEIRARTDSDYSDYLTTNGHLAGTR